MIRRVAFALLLAVAACAEDVDKAMTACNLSCDRQGAATSCPDLHDYVAACKSLCKVIIPALDQDCKDTAEEAYGCQSVLTWQCQAGSEVPTPTTAGCQTSLTALAVCLQNVGQ